MSEEPKAGVPAPEPDGERLAEGRRLRERVGGLLQQGRPEVARSVLGRAFADAAPELPLRFTVALVAVAPRALRALTRELALGGEPPELELAIGGVRKPRVEVKLADGRRLGSFSDEQARYLHSLDAAQELYAVRLTAVRASGEVEVEVLRPELSACSSCGALHPGRELNCESCRERRARKRPAAAGVELAPVGLHEAVDALLAEDARQRSGE
jgi:hypothetical protein